MSYKYHQLKRLPIVNTILAPSQKTLSIDELVIYERTKKSEIVGYLLWWFLGIFGIHQFYMGNKKKGLIYLSLWILFCFFLSALVLSAENILYTSLHPHHF